MKRRRNRSFSRSCSTALLVLGLIACAGDGEVQPPKILYGEDLCDFCRMVISEERHAAAARLAGETTVREARFDDPGCLGSFLVSDAGETGEPARAWVHGEDLEWVTIDRAWFVIDPEGRTPMGSGLKAFGSRAAALDTVRREGGEPLRWAALGKF